MMLRFTMVVCSFSFGPENEEELMAVISKCFMPNFNKTLKLMINADTFITA